MSTRSERASRRQALWTGEVVLAGAPKGPLYRELDPGERLIALARLNDRVWRATAALPLSPLPRSAWPGEIFEACRRRG